MLKYQDVSGSCYQLQRKLHLTIIKILVDFDFIFYHFNKVSVIHVLNATF